MSFVGTKVVIPETLAYSILGNSSSDSGLWVNLSVFALLCLCQDGFIWGHPSLPGFFFIKLFVWNSGNNLIAGA